MFRAEPALVQRGSLRGLEVGRIPRIHSMKRMSLAGTPLGESVLDSTVVQGRVQQRVLLALGVAQERLRHWMPPVQHRCLGLLMALGAPLEV